MFRATPLLAALLLPAPAYAGGLGLTLASGFTSEKVFFYDSSDNDAQYQQTQTILNFGTGLEFVLGDRDDKITGLFRGFWLQDAAQRDPALTTGLVDPNDVVANVREVPRNIGIATFGVQWGFLGKPDKFMLSAVTSVGAGFLTTDHTEFAMGQVGLGGTYAIGRTLQAYIDASGIVRYRKVFFPGAEAHIGIRVMFD